MAGKDFVTAHSGLSGSRYDMVVNPRLRKAATTLGETVLLQRAALAQAAAAVAAEGCAGGPDASGKLEALLRGRSTARALAAGSSTAESKRRASIPRRAPISTPPVLPREFSLTEDHKEVIATTFQLLDDNADGLLDYREVGIALAALGYPPAGKLREYIMESRSVPEGVDLETLQLSIVAYTRMHPIDLSGVQELMDCFSEGVDKLDGKRGPGSVGPAGVKRLLSRTAETFGMQLSDSDAAQIVRELHIDDGCVIDGAELARALTSGLQAVSSIAAPDSCDLGH